MKNKLEQIKANIMAELQKISASDALRDLEIKYLGRKGEFTNALKGIKDLAVAEKKEAGMLANKIKSEINAKIAELKQSLSPEASDDTFFDITLPGGKIKHGSLHPITQLQNELEDIFTAMGFMIADGPEVESDYYCFEALNISKDHPARDMQDTFYVQGKGDSGANSDLVMRTHTSSVQIRAMQKYGAPLRCIAPGRVFRNEASDASHDHTFNQMEGLMVGENISISNLIAVMKELLKGIFKKEMQIRIRPGYFPFVEPGFELEIACTICDGGGCSACKQSGWLELLPAGMVHPNVLRAGGVDPEKYQGFAFGLGLTRLAMMKHGIDHIRLFNSGDLRFLSQF